MRRQDLESDPSPERDLLGLVHRAHTTLAELADKPEVTEALERQSRFHRLLDLSGPGGIRVVPQDRLQ